MGKEDHAPPSALCAIRMGAAPGCPPPELPAQPRRSPPPPPFPGPPVVPQLGLPSSTTVLYFALHLVDVLLQRQVTYPGFARLCPQMTILKPPFCTNDQKSHHILNLARHQQAKQKQMLRNTTKTKGVT